MSAAEIERSGLEAVEAETHKHSPYLYAGYKNGDIVAYPHPTKQGSFLHLEVEIVEPDELDKIGGANLYSIDKNGTRIRVNETTAHTPSRISIYKYPTLDRAKEAFYEAIEGSLEHNGEKITIPRVKGTFDLYTLFNTLERSGLVPQDLGIKNFYSWQELKFAIHQLEELINSPLAENEKRQQCRTLANKISRVMRIPVLRLLEATELYEGTNLEKSKGNSQKNISEQESKLTEQTESPLQLIEKHKLRFKDLVNGEKVQVRNPENNEVITLVKYEDHFLKKKKTQPLHYVVMSDLEMQKIYSFEDVATWMVLDPASARIMHSAEARLKLLENEVVMKDFRAMKIGDVVVFHKFRYKKTKDDQFKPTHGDNTKDHTIALKTLSSEELETQIKQGLAFGWNIEFIKPDLSDIPIIQESSSDYLESQKFLNDHFAELYPENTQIKKGRFEELIGNINRNIFKTTGLSRSDMITRIKHSEINQGGYGDCYLLAAINSLKKTQPELYLEVLARSVRYDADLEIWKVCFKGDKSAELRAKLGEAGGDEIIISKDDIAAWRAKGSDASLGDIILERAYASLISRVTKQAAGKTMIADARGKIEFEGGFGHRALFDLLGSELVQKYKIASYSGEEGKQVLRKNGNEEEARDFLENQYSSFPEHYIVTANTPKSNGDKTKDDTYYKMVDGHRMYFKHAYSLVGYKNNMVLLQNPHKTSITISLTIDEFLDTFAQISYVAIKAKYKPVI